jgi:hypothetical protein
MSWVFMFITGCNHKRKNNDVLLLLMVSFAIVSSLIQYIIC